VKRTRLLAAALIAVVTGLGARAAASSAHASIEPSEFTGSQGPTARGISVDPRHLPGSITPQGQAEGQPAPFPEDPSIFAQQKVQANAAAASQAKLQAIVPGSAARAASFTSSFTGMDMNAACAPSLCYHTPDGAVAVGPTSVLEMVNQAFAVYGRTGNLMLGPIKLYSFFQADNPPYDVRTLYDASNAGGSGYGGGDGRFVIMALSKGTRASSYWIAVSQNSRPQSASMKWCTYRLDGTTSNIGQLAGADYPGMGMDGDHIYITSNQITFGNPPFFQGARILAIPKSSIYPNVNTGVCPTATSTDFRFPLNPDGKHAYTLQPASKPDALQRTGSTQMFFVNALRSGNSQIALRSIVSGPSGLTLGSPKLINVAPYSIPANVPQPGGGAIFSGGDNTLLGSMYRYGKIYTANSTRTWRGGGGNAYSNVQWYEITPGSSNAVTHVIGNPNVAYFMPQVVAGCTVNSSPCPSSYVALEFTGSGPNQPASAFGVLGTRSPAITRSGVAGYSFTGAWGDFPGVSVDPNDRSHVWLEGEYAGSPTDWGTVITPTCPSC